MFINELISIIIFPNLSKLTLDVKPLAKDYWVCRLSYHQHSQLTYLI